MSIAIARDYFRKSLKTLFRNSFRDIEWRSLWTYFRRHFRMNLKRNFGWSRAELVWWLKQVPVTPRTCDRISLPTYSHNMSSPTERMSRDELDLGYKSCEKKKCVSEEISSWIPVEHFVDVGILEETLRQAFVKICDVSFKSFVSLPILHTPISSKLSFKEF